MKNNLIISFCLVISLLTACGGGSNTAAPKPAAVQAGDYALTPYSGMAGMQKAVKVGAQENIEEEGDLLNGQREGTWATYHKGVKSHLLESVTNYRNGVKHGLFLVMDDRGNITEKGFYVNGNLEGRVFVYDRGRISEETDYKNGQIDGERKRYYSNLQLQEAGTFKNGKRDGYARWYDQDGNVTIEYQYKNGEKIGQNTATGTKPAKEEGGK
ncbi:MAG: toxin-antitoxin system YwqK family antitoxin [Chitinophagales bacterium]